MKIDSSTQGEKKIWISNFYFYMVTKKGKENLDFQFLFLHESSKTIRGKGRGLTEYQRRGGGMAVDMDGFSNSLDEK